MFQNISSKWKIKQFLTEFSILERFINGFYWSNQKSYPVVFGCQVMRRGLREVSLQTCVVLVLSSWGYKILTIRTQKEVISGLSYFSGNKKINSTTLEEDDYAIIFNLLLPSPNFFPVCPTVVKDQMPVQPHVWVNYVCPGRHLPKAE